MPYPLSEPTDAGYLAVGDGQILSWEVSGNPRGRPAVILHGGPGSGSSPATRRLFDPRAYWLVQFDQRGAGHSTPHAGDVGTDLAVNTTAHLVADIERLRDHLGIDSWLVYGGSWGATLAQAYVQQHPSRVTAMVLAAVTMTRAADVRWLCRGVGRFFPAEFARFRAGVPAADRDGDLSAAYARLLASPSAAVRAQAARAWCDWEDVLVSAETGGRAQERFADPRFRLGFARVVTHYFSHAAWLGEDELLRGAARLGHIPAVLIHGRQDLAAPPHTARELAAAWPGSDLVLVDGSGHLAGPLTDHVITATDRFR